MAPVSSAAGGDGRARGDSAVEQGQRLHRFAPPTHRQHGGTCTHRDLGRAAGRSGGQVEQPGNVPQRVPDGDHRGQHHGQRGGGAVGRASRDGAWVTELTGLLDLAGWPEGMRVIVRAERPHPGAQPRFTDADGNRLTAFATNTRRGQLPDLELRHRRRARCEDRIRNAKDTGLRNLPLHDFSQNQIWIAVVMLATELTAWMQMLALTGTPARVWEPKRLRLRLFQIAGRIARRSRRLWINLSAHAPSGHLVTTAMTALTAAPATRRPRPRRRPHPAAPHRPAPRSTPDPDSAHP
jgi:hypothetical protein